MVFDSSNQAATLTRELVYTDYTPPRITLTEPLRFSLNETEEWDTSDFLQYFKATDCLDGDITSQIRMNIDGNGYIDGAGTYPITLQVNNSAGDVTSVPVEMTIVDPEDERILNVFRSRKDVEELRHPFEKTVTVFRKKQ